MVFREALPSDSVLLSVIAPDRPAATLGYAATSATPTRRPETLRVSSSPTSQIHTRPIQDIVRTPWFPTLAMLLVSTIHFRMTTASMIKTCCQPIIVPAVSSPEPFESTQIWTLIVCNYTPPSPWPSLPSSPPCEGPAPRLTSLGVTPEQPYLIRLNT